MAIAVTYTFTNGTTAEASEVNQVITDLATGAVDKTGDTMTGALTTTGVSVTGTGASALDVAGGAQFGTGNVALIGTDGKINGPLSSTILDDLSGANLTTLNASNISTGTLGVARGGTGADLSSTGAATHVLRQASTGAVVTVGAIVRADLPVGTIIQVVMGTYAISATSTSSTYADSGLTVNITPTDNGNKILVFGVQAGCYSHTSDTGIKLKLVRVIGGTPGDVYEPALADGVDNSSGDTSRFTIPFTYLDAPATTSAVTYKTQFASSANSDGVEVQTSSTTSVIIACEVAV